MSDQRTQRKYALTRIKAGDYLLPGNDGRTLWRIYSYEEDGSGEWCVNGKWVKITGTYWGVMKYDPYGVVDFSNLPDDFLEWDRWSSWGSLLATRQAAINEVLRASDLHAAYPSKY